MTMQIRSLRPAAAEFRAQKAAERGTPVRDLAKALRSGDLAAASKAYDTLVAKAPERAGSDADGPFAQLGAALSKGDLDAARAAFASIFTSHLPERNALPPIPAASGAGATQTTTGAPGALLNVSA